MKWVRWCLKYREGTTSEWEYFQTNDDWNSESIYGYINDELIDASDRYNDGFRGFNFDVIDKPPLEYILYNINLIEERLRLSQKYLAELYELRKQYD